MLAYIFRRLLLIIPTLFGILLINFLIIQAAPGGPVEQMIAKLEGFDGATSRIAGGGAEVSVAGSNYRGAQGLDPELVGEIERMYGFDKPAPERFWIMLVNYLHLDFGESFFRDAKVTDLIHPQSVFMLHGFGTDVPAKKRSFGKGLADQIFMKGKLKEWDKAGGGLNLNESFVTVIPAAE